MTNLDVLEIESGIRKCQAQSLNLFKDGILLLDNERYATSYALFQLASEEIAKVKILMRAAIEKRSGIEYSDDRDKYFKGLFKNHTEKNKLAVTTDQNYNFLAAKINLPKFRNENDINNELKNPKPIDVKKQDGFYVSLKGKKFKSPSESITPLDCEKLKDIVSFRITLITDNMNYYFDYPNFMVNNFINSEKQRS